jgi:Tfp pilus assembly protein PilF
MAWPNPHPERAIRSITFESKNFGVPVLVGVTVGIKTTQPEATAIATVTDAANARALVYTRQQAKDWAGAVIAIKQWLSVEPHNLEALFLLGKAYEEIGDFKAAEQTYRQSLEINRNQPEVLRTLEAVTTRKQ